MYLSVHGNTICVCTLTTQPMYLEETGEYKQELTRIGAKALELSPEGTQTIFMTVLFYKNMAIPAKALKAGDVIVVFGREMSKEKFQWGKHKLERTVIADFWIPRWIDPLGMITNLQVHRDATIKEREYKTILAEYLTECKPAIIQWVVDYFKSMKAANNSKQKDGEQQ